MKNNTNKFVGSLAGVASVVMIVAALLFLVSTTVALAEGAPGSSSSSNTGSTGGGAAPAGSVSGNTIGVPSASNSSNTGSTSGAPASSNSSNTGSTGAPSSSNSSNTGSTGAPSSSNSSNSSNNPSQSSNNTPAGGATSGPVGGGANGAPGSFTFGPGSSFVPITLPGSQPVVATVPSVTNTNVGGAVATGGTCASYLNSFLAPGVKNTAEVTKLQSFLAEQGFSVDVNGIYDEKTTQAVSDFQLKYSDDVLRKSWGASIPSGTVYITTKMKINDLVCNHQSDFAALSYLGKDRKAQMAANGSTEENVAGSGATVASGSNTDSSSTDEGGTQEASVAKTSGGFFSRIGAWFTSVFKRNK